MMWRNLQVSWGFVHHIRRIAYYLILVPNIKEIIDALSSGELKYLRYQPCCLLKAENILSDDSGKAAEFLREAASSNNLFNNGCS